MKFQLLIKIKILKNKDCSCFKTRRCFFFIYPAKNAKMPTTVGILTFMSWINFMVSWVEHEKSCITSGRIMNLHVTLMLPTKFQLHLGYLNGTILASLNHCVAQMLDSIWYMVWGEISFEEFQYNYHGGHLGYRKKMILTFLTLHVAEMSHIKGHLKPTYGFGGDVENVKSYSSSLKDACRQHPIA